MLGKLRRLFVPTALAVAVSLSAAPSRADDAASRWIALLPFGAGQLHRGDVGVGLFFALGEVLLGGTSIVAGAVVGVLGSTRVDERGPDHGVVAIGALNDKIKTAAMVNRVAFASWASLTAAGIVEAQMSVGRRSSAPRDRPSPSIEISAAPVPGGATIGIQLSF